MSFSIASTFHLLPHSSYTAAATTNVASTTSAFVNAARSAFKPICMTRSLLFQDCTFKLRSRARAHTLGFDKC